MKWLHGCWSGQVKDYQFREHWMAPAGNVLLGVGQTLNAGKLTDYEYLRIEQRNDGSLAYIALPVKQQESVYVLTKPGPEDYVFSRESASFPQRIVYHPGNEGWLYASAEGLVNGSEKKVYYPMRRVDCETGEFITK